MYLLQKEVAERLGCSTSRVKRLRLSGKLVYCRGRPVLIDEVDLNEFIASEQAKKAERAMRTRRGRKAAQRGPEPGSPEAEEQQLAAARFLAQRTWFIRQWTKKRRRAV